MPFLVSTLIAQFGDGFTPPAETLYTQGAESDPLTNMEIIVSNMIGLITVMGTIVFLYYFVSGALTMITNSGDSGKMNGARDKMMHAAVGLIVLVATYGVAGLIASIVGIDILNPKELLLPLVPGTS